MKDIDQFFFYKLGHYLRLDPAWNDIPYEAKNLLQRVGQDLMKTSSQTLGSYEGFDRFWDLQLENTAKSGQDFITLVPSNDTLAPKLQAYIQEQKSILSQQQHLYALYPFFPPSVWQELVYEWSNEEEQSEERASASFFLGQHLFPLNKGETYQKLKQLRRAYKKLSPQTSTRFAPSVRTLCGQLLDICERLKPLDIEVDRVYKFMDTLFWSHRRKKSNAHQLEGVGRELEHMKKALEHARAQLIQKTLPLSLAHGFVSYATYFDNPQWALKEEVEKTIMSLSLTQKNSVLTVLDRALLNSGR